VAESRASMTTNNQPLFCSHYTAQPALASTSRWIMSVQFYCPHALADGKHELSVDGDILKMHLQRNKQYIKNIT